MQKSLIALVATAVLIDGVRTVIQPGEKLPPLPAHDEKALVDGGSANDGVADAKEKAAREAAEKKGTEEFAAARAAVIAQVDSIKPEGDADAADATSTGTTTPTGKTAGKTTKSKA